MDKPVQPTNDVSDIYVTKYLESLSKDQLKIIEIAKNQLKTSYDIKKSIGFLIFIKTQNSYNL
jgi:hypothetical protein